MFSRLIIVKQFVPNASNEDALGRTSEDSFVVQFDYIRRTKQRKSSGISLHKEADPKHHVIFLLLELVGVANRIEGQGQR